MDSSPENNWGKEMTVKLLSSVWLFVTPWTVAYQAPLSMGFSRQEYWSGLPFPSPGDLPDPGIEPRSPTLQADTLLSEPPGKQITENNWYQKTTLSENNWYSGKQNSPLTQHLSFSLVTCPNQSERAESDAEHSANHHRPHPTPVRVEGGGWEEKAAQEPPGFD